MGLVADSADALCEASGLVGRFNPAEPPNLTKAVSDVHQDERDTSPAKVAENRLQKRGLGIVEARRERGKSARGCFLWSDQSEPPFRRSASHSSTSLSLNRQTL